MAEDALNDPTRVAVDLFWTTRADQESAQAAGGAAGGAARAARHLHGIRDLIEEIFIAAGMPRESITREAYLPGYYRARKRWDMAVTHKGALVAALELKSMAGSVAKNINNRLEEALGSATDTWTAQRKLAVYGDVTPWLGYVLVLGEDEETEAVGRPVNARFPTDPAFSGMSYGERWQEMITRLLDEGIYQAAWFITTSRAEDGTVYYSEPLAAASGDAFRDAVQARVAYIRNLLDLPVPSARLQAARWKHSREVRARPDLVRVAGLVRERPQVTCGPRELVKTRSRWNSKATTRRGGPVWLENSSIPYSPHLYSSPGVSARRAPRAAEADLGRAQALGYATVEDLLKAVAEMSSPELARLLGTSRRFAWSLRKKYGYPSPSRVGPGRAER